MSQNSKHLRLGRVYHIAPDPIPPYKTIKEREAVYVGKINVKNKKMNLFIQMGSKMYVDSNLDSFNDKTRYFWKNMGREGFFHLASSKPEYARCIVNVYTTKNSFVELSIQHAKALKKIWINSIVESKSKRWKKAYAYFLLDQEGKALKQLYLLKYTMPWEYKFLKPTLVIKKWTAKQKKSNND